MDKFINNTGVNVCIPVESQRYGAAIFQQIEVANHQDWIQKGAAVVMLSH